MLKTIPFLAILIFGLAFAQVVEAQKILVDPNTPASASPKNDNMNFWKSDPRLSSKITYTATYRPLRLVLADISKTTGVKLLAGLSSVDWQVRDRKMNISVTDVSLADMMQSIARVMKFKWKRHTNRDPNSNTDITPPTYRLIMDRTILINRKSESLLSKQAQFIADIEALAKASDADILSLRNTNPYMYALASTGTAAALSKFMAAVPMIKDALTYGERVSSVPPDSGSAAYELLCSTMRMNALEKSGKVLSPEMLSSAKVVVVDANLSSRSSYYIGDLIISYRLNDDEDTLHQAFLQIRDPNVPSCRSLYSVMLDAQNEDVPFSVIVERADRKAEADGITDDSENKDNQSDDPVLTGSKMSIDIQKSKDKRLTIADYEFAFAKASGLSIVSDSFAQHKDEMNFTKGELTPGAFLKRFATAFQYKWVKRQKIVELWDRDWFAKRSMQIPDATLNQLRTAISKKGELELDDLVQIGPLNDASYSLNILGDSTLENSNLETALSSKFGWLSFYMKLLPNQRRMLCSNTYLDGSQLNDELKAVIKGYMISTCTLSYFANGLNRIASVRENGKFQLKAYSPDNQTWLPLSWTPIPIYK